MIHRSTTNHSRTSHQTKIIQKILAEEPQIEDSLQQVTFNFEVCIDIGDGRKSTLRIDEKSDPLMCALQFCHDHELDQVIAGILCQSIKEKIDNERKSIQKSLIADGKKLHINQLDEWQQPPIGKLPQNSNTSKREVDSTMQDITTNKMSNSVSVHQTNTKPKQRTQSQWNVLGKQNNQQYSHKPRINQISKIITEKLQKGSLVDQIELNMRRKQLKVDKLKKQLVKKQMAQCSFKPKINLISSKVDSEIKREGSGCGRRYEQLYQQSFAIQRHREHQRNKSSENMTFKPEINSISKTIVSGLSFEQRQERFRHSKPETIVFNPIPKTGRKPRSRNSSNMPIGEYLYSKAKKKQGRNSVCVQPSDHRLIALGKSQDIINHLKETRLKEIFKMLDNDHDGRIRYEEIHEEALDPQVMDIFLPILEEMRQLNIELDQAQFLEASQRLLDSLSLQERNVILNTKKRIDRSEIFTFKPQINKKYMNTSQYTQDLYTRGLQDKKKLRDKVERSKEEQARAQLTQCTFKPKIVRYQNPLYTNLG